MKASIDLVRATLLVAQKLLAIALKDYPKHSLILDNVLVEIGRMTETLDTRYW